MKKVNFRKIGSLITLVLIAGSSHSQKIFSAAAGNKSSNAEGRGIMLDNDGREDLRRYELGIRYMPTFTNLNFRTADGGTIKGAATVSHGVGAMTAVNFNSHIGLQLELDYYKTNQTYNDNSIKREVSLTYINIPLLLSLNTSKKSAVNLNFVAGPQLGINLASTIKSTGTESADTLNAVVAVNHRDIGFAYGAGLEFALNKRHSCRLDVGYRGFYGLVNIDNAPAAGGNSYNVVIKSARIVNAGYIGLTILF
jgi:opacity protein-like surface antigen